MGLLQTSLLELQAQLPATMPVESPKLTYTRSIDEWIYKLGMCESGNNPKALNPKDTDGTPSKGKFQFKDSTFNWLSKKYNIATTSIWNADEQEQILRRMIEDDDIDLSRQFPDCVRKLGLPNQVE